MRIVICAVAAAALLTATPAAAAREPSIWVKCDGLPRPEGAGVIAARILAISTTMGLLGLPENSREEPAAQGAEGVAACSEALAEPVLEDYWARRINLLRARALHHVEAGDHDAALTDLRATHDVAVGDANKLFFDRSLGLSVQLFEAALLAKRGKLEEAEALVVKASDARPYSTEIGQFAAGILLLDPASTEAEERILTRLATLDPAKRRIRAVARDWSGDAAGAAADWLAALQISDKEVARVKEVHARYKSKAPLPQRDRLLMAKAALALARAGHTEQARELVAELNTDPQMQRFGAIVEAVALSSEGKLEEARTRLAAEDGFPMEPAVFDLLTRLAADKGAYAATDIAALKAGEQARIKAERVERLGLLDYAKALPPLERADKSNKYSAQGWGGFKPSGFKDRPLKDEDGRTIEFVGAASQHAAVEEMMLMRAAQLAMDAGKPAFIVRDRKDYRQMLVTNSYGVQTETPAGFKTEATVVFVDPAALPQAYASQKDRVLLANQVWSDLTPVHGDGKPKK